ncbi:hypothetical protein [Thalassovita mangrovi]|uniref:Uncharacterized protein n=1 Tax=Thalassovita mangrovi TaxID=2692236 RepID=A0A6L8LG55_9RHOB|nr:hypothetical protein [Thalassovita mangrovi]MYM55077.1 hypothetical protein [Thalassovita mangrovi]
MNIENRTPRIPVWIHPVGVLGLAALLAIMLVALQRGLEPFDRQVHHIQNLLVIYLLCVAIGACLWWAVLGLRQRTPPVPLLRPGRARILGTVLLWLFVPVGYGFGIPITNLWLWAHIILRKGATDQPLVLISLTLLILCYVIASTLISVTKRGGKRILAFVIAGLCIACAVYIVVGSASL